MFFLQANLRIIPKMNTEIDVRVLLLILMVCYLCFVKGLGILDFKLIPHFDVVSSVYKGATKLLNSVEEFILSYSDNNLIYALPNNSFILWRKYKNLWSV